MYTAEEYERRTYEDLSNEFQEIYPVTARAFELIPLMYNRLTLVDGVNHKVAVEKIIADHQQFSGFSARNIRRYLPSDNPMVPKRVRPSWPKNSITGIEKVPQLSNIEQDNSAETELHHQDDGICSFDAKQESIIDFEFSLPWDDVHRYMGLKFKVDGIYGKVWFNGTIDIQTGKVIAASVGTVSEYHHDDN